MIYDKLPVVLLSALTAEKSDSANKAIASYILEHQEEVRTLSIKELASRCYVGTGSVSRFVRDIGLNDFSELKALLSDTYYHFEANAYQDDPKMRIQTQKDRLKQAIDQAVSSLDPAEIRALCNEINRYKKVYTCGFLKAQNAATDLQVDLRMLGKQIYTNVGYAEQIEHITTAEKDELIIVFSYTGSYFKYPNLRAREGLLYRPCIWMICGTYDPLPDYINGTVRFASDHDQRSHPFQLEAAESVIVQEYASLFAR